VTGAPRGSGNQLEAEWFEPKINPRVHQAAGVNGQEFHLLDIMVGLPDSFKTNSISRNTDENQLSLRVMARLRAYFSREPTVANCSRGR